VTRVRSTATRWGKAILVVAVLAASILTLSRAEAATWLTPGVGCVPDTSDVNLRSQGNLPWIEFRLGAVGTFNLYCPVTPGAGAVQGPGFKLDLYYLAAVSSNQVYVQVRLFKMALRTGITTFVGGCGFITSVTSPTYRIRTATCTESFDPNTFLYYAVVEMRRTSPNQTLRFYGLSLFK
jgi:hypothetical protein